MLDKLSEIESLRFSTNEKLAFYIKNLTVESSEKNHVSSLKSTQAPHSGGPSEISIIPYLNTIQDLFPLDSIQPFLLQEYNVVDPQPQTGSPYALSFDLVVEGDLPKDKRGESNILVASEEPVVRSLS